MSLDQFGLRHPPFRPQSADGSVFAGSQQIALAGGLKRALASPDAVVTVSGEVGVGKTTSVRYALSRLGVTTSVARIGRVHLGRDEILDVLLDEFQVASKPASALQRYNALQRLLRNWSDVGTSVFVIVEDAERLGVDTLAELESLTATESDNEPGAHLILMGGPKLRKFLKAPALARLKQRVRRSLILDPFSADETEAYVAHLIGEAGGDVSKLFDSAALDVVHACSNGVARVINTFCEALLYQAEDLGVDTVSADLALDVAREDFDYEGDMPEADEDSHSRSVTFADEPPEEDDMTSLVAGITGDAWPEVSKEPPDVDSMPADNIHTEVEADTDAEPTSFASPADEAESNTDSHTDNDADADAEAEADNEIPALIQDTQPGLRAVDPVALLRSERLQPVTTPEELARMREKTDSTQPSLPVLRSPDEERSDSNSSAEQTAGNDAEPEVTNDHLEPKVPEPLSKSVDPADSQTIRALDDALRPDTQLLQTLDDPVAPIVDEEPEPPELHADNVNDAPLSDATATDVVSEELPTLSPSMRFDREPDSDQAAPEGLGTGTVVIEKAAEPALEAETESQDAVVETAIESPEAGVAEAALTDASIEEPVLAPIVEQVSADHAVSEPTNSSGPDVADADLSALPTLEFEPDLTDETALDEATDVVAEQVDDVADLVTDNEPTAPETPPAETLADDVSQAEQPGELSTATIDAVEPIESTEALSDVSIAEGPASLAEAEVAVEIEAADESASIEGSASIAEAADDNELPDLSLVPEITLDAKLQEHQQEAQSRLDEEAAKIAESAADDEEADEETRAAAEEARKKREDEEQRKRIESLAARFENAKSIEDVMDDTAAETLFGEEFSQIAAAVTAMHEAQTADAVADTTTASNDAANIGAVVEPALEHAASADMSLELEPEPVAQAAVDSPTASAPSPASVSESRPTPPPASPASGQNPDMPDLESSAARRFEMVRALNKKVGKPMPNVPNEPGEEIVLGSSDASPTCSGPAPEPIENQFGESMTAKLRALSAENIEQMQREEKEKEEKKAKKGGLFSRFRRG